MVPLPLSSSVGRPAVPSLQLLQLSGACYGGCAPAAMLSGYTSADVIFFGKMGGADPLWLATHTTAE